MKKDLLYVQDTDFVRENMLINYCLEDNGALLIESFIHNNQIDIHFDHRHFYFFMSGVHRKFVYQYTPESFNNSLGWFLQTRQRTEEQLKLKGYSGNIFLIKEDNSKQFGLIFSPSEHTLCTPYEMAQIVHDLYTDNDTAQKMLSCISTSFVGPFSGYENIHTAFHQARELNDLLFFGVNDIVITEDFMRSNAQSSDITAILGNVRALVHSICMGTLNKAIRQADYIIDMLVSRSFSMVNFQALYFAYEDVLGMLETVYPERICLKHQPRTAFHRLFMYKEYVHASLHEIFDKLKDIPRYSPIILMALSYINRNYHRDLSLVELSEYVYANASTLSSDFNNETGMSLSEYITGLRVEKAKQLLCESSAPIADIAIQTGFSNEKYFREIFKKQTGRSPKQYREDRL